MLALQWEHDKAIRASYEDGVESVAINLIKMGMNLDKIHEATRLPIERIKELALRLGYKMKTNNN